MFSIWLSMSYWIFSKGCVVFLRRRRVLHWGIEVRWSNSLWGGIGYFSPLVELSFRSLVLLLAAADLLFRPPLVMANGGGGSYIWQPSEDMVDMLSAPFTPYSGWAYIASFAASTSVESSVGGDCGSVWIWCCSTAMEFSEAVDGGGCKEDEG